MDVILFACLGGALTGGVNLAFRLALARVPDVVAISVVTTVIGLLVALALGVSLRPAVEEVHIHELWPFFAVGAFVPGVGLLLFVRAVKEAGSARTGVLIATAPVLSALIAITVLGEPLRGVLLAGTLLIVGGGVVLARERKRPNDYRLLGTVLALIVAFMIGVRDNFLRWAAGETEMAPVLAIAAVLLAGSATMLFYFLIESRGRSRVARLRNVVLPSLPIGVLTGIASIIILEALDRGRVTVVAPLIATQALWVVALSALIVQRTEAVGRHLTFAAILVAAGAALIGTSQ